MARTIQEIQNQILAEKAVHPELAGLTSTSRVSIWRLWTYITAVAIHTLERLFDIFKKEVDQTIARAQIHTFLWYRHKALALENGLSITDAIEAGTEINMTKNKFLNTGTLNYYRENNIVPATAGTVVDTRNRGIGAMLIGSNTSLVFKVN